MAKTAIAILAALWCISLASAASLSLSPSSFEITGFPGESLQRNLTIFTAGNYSVFINGINQDNISITSGSPFVVEGNRTVTVTFTLPTGIAPGVYLVNITGSMQYAEVIVYDPVPFSSGGGGGGFIGANYYVHRNFTNPASASKTCFYSVTNGSGNVSIPCSFVPEVKNEVIWPIIEQGGGGRGAQIKEGSDSSAAEPKRSRVGALSLIVGLLIVAGIAVLVQRRSSK